MSSRSEAASANRSEQPQTTLCNNIRSSNNNDSESVLRSLALLDPVLRFLTRATGQTLIPLESLRTALPTLSKAVPLEDFRTLERFGIVRVEAEARADPSGGDGDGEGGGDGDDDGDGDTTEPGGTSRPGDNDGDDEFQRLWNHPPAPSASPPSSSSSSSSSISKIVYRVGFPSGDVNPKLCGSTKTAAKRRLAALKRCLRNQQQEAAKQQKEQQQPSPTKARTDSAVSRKEASPESERRTLPIGDNNGVKNSDTDTTNSNFTTNANKHITTHPHPEPLLTEDEKQARNAMREVLGLSCDHNRNKSHPHRGAKSTTRGHSSSSSFASASGVFGATPIPDSVLPGQLSYAGTQPGQTAEYEDPEPESDEADANGTNFLRLHPILRGVFGLKGGPQTNAQRQTTRTRRLYKHQAAAIRSAMLHRRHTLVCIGTGSGKSLCFWIPVLQRAIEHGQTSLLLFPTKALAQDQLVQLQTLLEGHPELAKHVVAAALDGDTPHSQRALIAQTCNVVVTNPDTLHAAILPKWETLYRPLLEDLACVVIDEAHSYEGVFGAHVAMILARLCRVRSCCAAAGASRNANANDGCEWDGSECEEAPTTSSAVTRVGPSHEIHETTHPDAGSFSSSPSPLLFLACSATLAHPEQHFRLLCRIPSSQPVTVLTDDFSPRAAKHFFVWNPPLLDEHGKSLGYVAWPKKAKPKRKKPQSRTRNRNQNVAAAIQKQDPSADSTRTETETKTSRDALEPVSLSFHSSEIEEQSKNAAKQRSRKEIRRRHSADETALLLARAVTKGVRCIAFCKTRCLVEWVYERCIKALKQSPGTAKLISKVDSYRGGYSKIKRREIEEKLFHNQLLGVVGTSALELGVDIGGVGLTLHCGFPSSHASLMQQAGRAGRGAAASHQPSLAICVCFNSPIDQHLWRHPTSLLSRGLSAPLSMPIYPGLVQGHLICAGNEFPLTGPYSASAIQSVEEKPADDLLSDEELFGSKEVYLEAMEQLVSKGSFSTEKIAVYGGKFISVFKTHPSIKNPWTDVSIRSIETVNYDIVDISHPMQGNRMDGNHHEAAIMDNIPYSRVFYHAFPGAIITHRGRRYKIVSMTRPPAFGVGFRSTVTLGAYAKPSTHRYCTRPLSNLKITVVKQMERVDLLDKGIAAKEPNPTPDVSTIFSDDLDPSLGSFAGCGMITVKRNVHGYKKISLVTRDELSRSELSLPDMEYDTFAFWIDCDASGLGRFMSPQAFGYGVHALSHALCNVAPLFVPCVLNDVQCDHSFYSPTRVVIFDSRAGGSGITAQLWKSIFTPRGLVQAAIDLLESCSSCADDVGYTGGCPACIQAGECIKFNDFLCKSSALIIARHMLQRLQKTELYKEEAKEKLNEAAGERSQPGSEVSPNDRKKRKENDPFGSPRREKRRRAMRAAMDIDPGRQRHLVIGRPSWPMDRSEGTPREQQEA